MQSYDAACELDVRPGGEIRLDMTAPDGTVHPFRGVYSEGRRTGKVGVHRGLVFGRERSSAA
ncbi:SRPBCC family protein [Camelliibacillus cellulosilyticus]|uniref:SRPBCC family protein n=1 Tax=Camelliibacillus cellulosilyticus TaxID=2174486 RepID=UPI00366B760D